MITDRLRRVIRLLTLLQQADGLRLQELTRWLDCSQRTLYRDLQLLKDSGFEVRCAASGYRIEMDPELPSASLETAELLALLAAIRSSPLMTNESNRGLVHRALQKLFSACSPKTRSRWIQLVRRLQSSQNGGLDTESLLASLAAQRRDRQRAVPAATAQQQ